MTTSDNFSARSVIVPNPKLRIDQVKLPYHALVELLQQSIINILKKAGATIPLVTTGVVISLEYRIQYVPVVSTRIKQKKVNQDDFDTQATLVYNQQANGVNSASYGENMKGAVLRYGNQVDTETYYTNSITKVPALGTIYVDKYVSVINYEFYKDFIKYTIEYSKNFNRLSGFTGVQSNVRMWQVSERQIVNRNILYSSDVTIGTLDATKQDENTMIKFQGQLGIANTFNQRTSSNADATLAILRTFRDTGETLKTFALPLNTFAAGNSLIFTCKFADNYSAGNKAIRGEVTNKLIADYVNYTDEYGEFKYLGVAYTTPTDTQTDYQAIGDNLPEIDLTTVNLRPCVISTVMAGHSPLYDLTVDGALDIQKGNRDTPTVTTQINFLTNDNDFVLGYGLTHSNQLVCDRYIGKPAKVYAMPRKIGQFEKTVDLTGATLLKTFDTSNIFTDWDISHETYMSINPIQTTVNSQSLAIVNDDGDLILAVNKSKNALQYYSSIVFNLK